MCELSPLNLLRLAAQGALVGEVTDRLFALTAAIEGRHLHVRGYFTGPVTEDDVEAISYIGTEVIAIFGRGYTIDEEALSLDEYPLECLQFWAFLRKAEDT